MHDNQIIYPALVEQSYAFLLSKGIKVSKDMVYRQMIKANMIDQNGQPTQKAIETGLVSTTNDPHSLAVFKAQNRLFLPYDDHHFKWLPDIRAWAADEEVTRDVAKRIVDGRAIGNQQQARALLKRLNSQGNDRYEWANQTSFIIS